MTTRATTVGSLAMVLLLAAGCAMIAYARWTQPIADADAATDAGDYPRALAAYAAAEGRFESAPPLRRLLSSEYDRIVANQLWLLHRLERYEEAIDKAARSPEGAHAHFWAGAACFEQGRAEADPALRLAWFGRALEELRRALDAAPEDWDTKYDLELAMRLFWELRRQPNTPPSEVLELLRPEPKPGTIAPKRVG